MYIAQNMSRELNNHEARSGPRDVTLDKSSLLPAQPVVITTSKAPGWDNVVKSFVFF